MKTKTEVEERVIAAYRAEPVGGKTLARRFKIGATTLYRILNRNGVRIDDRKRQAGLTHRFALSEEQQCLTISRTEAGERSASIARDFGVSKYTVLAMLKRHGVTTKIGKPKRSVATEELAEAARLYSTGSSQEEIAKTFGVSQGTISGWLRLQGISKRNSASGPDHGSWAGGRSKTNQGYLLVLLPTDDPLRCMALSNGYVLEHRLVMARHLGRPLSASETVHHINGARADNRIENLELRRGKHGNGIGLACGDCGSRNVVEKALS